jgi:mycofactocin system glycosyltransferase
VVIGGSPRRVLRLTARGASVTHRLLNGDPVSGNGDALLARRLLDAGIAHPVPPSAVVGSSIEVVVPVYDDVVGLAACLAALGSELPVTVVDDGSTDRDGVAAAASAHGARLIRHERNGGPAAARNTGARACTADVIAFVDSDAVVASSTLRHLAAHLADPAVVGAAPRVRAVDAGRGVLGVIAAHWSPLDQGARPGPVAPTQRVAYVPSTVLVVDRVVLLESGGFDESLRYGEDVDLVWRLAAEGRTLRYDPTLQVRHAEPQTWASWLRRRFAYGTSAATLTKRHRENAAPLFIAPAPAASVFAALCGAPIVGALIAGTTALRLRRRLREAAVPTADATRGALLAPPQAALGAAHWAGQLWWPILLLAAGSRRRRTPVLWVLLAPPLVEYVRRRPPVDPLRWTVAVLADDAAYGLGVWAGCLRQRTMRPLLPRIGAVSEERGSRRRHRTYLSSAPTAS